MNQALLINDLSTQDEKEFLRLVTENQGIIHKVCNVYCTDEEQRKDLFQEVLIQLWKSYPSFRGDSKFSTWMYRVSLFVALQDVRKGKIRPEEVALDASIKGLSFSPKQDDEAEEVRLLYVAIAQLNEVEKAIVLLYLDEKNYEEIAEIIGISQNYVRVRMNRAKKKLRKILNDR